MSFICKGGSMGLWVLEFVLENLWKLILNMTIQTKVISIKVGSNDVCFT